MFEATEGKEGADYAAPWSSPCLLVVDDQPILAEFMAQVGLDRGWAAFAALNASEFDTFLDMRTPDVVILDLALPDRDGVELLRTLVDRRFKGGVVIISGCDVPVLESSALLANELGLNVLGFAQKPVTTTRLSALIGKYRRTANGS